MKTSKLIPQDDELFIMIDSITGCSVIIEENDDSYNIEVNIDSLTEKIIIALDNSIKGRLGDRYIKTENKQGKNIYYCKYGDWESYPEVIILDNIPITEVDGTHYAHRLKELDIIQVRRDNLEDLQKFTGGGMMIIPRVENKIAKYRFCTKQGIIIEVGERYYIARLPNGILRMMEPAEFYDYELK